ncbi:MAG: hypothetical protein COW00_06895 [Bdellovibrio sp. CG12_big_fil_rev_8_21_14_0_65_39_13]|nr:MAG: hypothetical protein COW78_03015 [Bdellovibrio sp. CG22_combo_CG10-13_8_21_14_all_39_27]PIQ60330.1 MAG: hypothetical protein COW00_06895 [Bdellovibrio sp. CG12_big_fil_rev_8_21_14_0_65_39_13]PIR35060.1 MAG: hypothetical protein COV37_10570 [Bdellovibrio sp. CG11_big_fil_rev_8_21_14_0_20_39_38]
MKKILLVTVMCLWGSSAFAKKNCTEEPKSKWMTEEAFKEKVSKEGYIIKKFKQPGSCYEIYGKNAKGESVEVYFNPVDASVVKSEIEDD